MELRARKYQQAAVAYLVYGVIYLAGAIYLGRMGRGPEGSVWWYLVGAAIALGLPYLIWNQYTWVTRILSLLVLLRAVALARIAMRGGTEAVPLPWGGDMATWQGAILFMLVAAITGVLLARAGWERSPAREPHSLAR